MPYTSSDTSTRRATIRGGIQTRPLEYKPSSEMFMNVINTLNERQEKIKDVETSIAESINKFNLNPQEQEFRNKKIREYSAMIKDNPMSLINAKDAARKLADDKQLLGRAKYQEKFEEITGIVKSNNKINNDTKEWWLSKHPYDYTETTDSNGDILSNTYEPTDLPYDDVDWDELFDKAFKMASPTSTSHSSSSGHYDNGTGSTKSSSSSVKEMTKTKLDDMVNTIVGETGVANQIEQARQVAEYVYQRELKKLENMPDGADRERQKEYVDALRARYGLNIDGTISLSAFKKYHIENSKFGKLMAYRWTDTSSSSSSQKTDRTAGSDQEGGNGKVTIINTKPEDLDSIVKAMEGNAVAN